MSTSATGSAADTADAHDGAPRNRLLAMLPEADLARLAPDLEHVRPGLREVLFDIDCPIEHVYFPESCVVSVLAPMADGTAIETATIGLEGMVGLPLFHGTDRTSAQGFCQVPGDALRMRADAFRAAVATSAALTQALHRYTQALFTLISQSSGCNRRHTMDERCARWLLHTHDRVGAERGVAEFPLTHQFLSQMLGVRRATVTEALGRLQAAGCIGYERGLVAVRDRTGLEAAACECYAVIRVEFDRLLGAPGTPRVASPLAQVRSAEAGLSVLGAGVPRGGRDDDAGETDDGEAAD